MISWLATQMVARADQAETVPPPPLNRLYLHTLHLHTSRFPLS